LGCDHVLLQVRGNGDALYRSDLEPWSEVLGGKDPGFDPLAAAVAAGHALGLEVHAWVNVVPGWRGAAPPRSPRHLFHTHPEWFLVGRDGRREPLRKDYYVGLNPCLPAVRAHIVAVCRDIAGRYRVDGLHLDYIRFLERPRGADYPYDRRTLALYRRDTGLPPEEDGGRWDEWRRGCITRLVREIRRAVKDLRPDLHLSAAVSAKLDYGRTRNFQDAREWARAGLVDALYAMNYHVDDGVFAGRARDTIALQAHGVPVLQGIGAFKHLAADPAATARQIGLARELGAAGVGVFAYASLFAPADRPARRRLRAGVERAFRGR
jgi:uncharacterized lipoprotein YddW (UPF0748 family)